MKKIERLNVEDQAISNRIWDGLQKCIGKNKAATCKFIVKKLQSEGHKVTDVKVRSLIHHLRVQQEKFICGDENGFYVPASSDDRRHQIVSLDSRIRAITEVRDALVKIDLQERKQTELEL